MMTKYISLSLFLLAMNSSLFAQFYTESFEGWNHATPQSSCWSFVSACVETSNGGGSLINGASVRTAQLTSMIAPRSVGTPCTSFGASGTLSFDHYVHSLSGSSLKRLDLVLVDPSSGAEGEVMDTLMTHIYTNTDLIHTSIPISFSGDYQIEWRWIGAGGQGRAWLDNLSIGGEKNADANNFCSCNSSSFPVEWAEVGVKWVQDQSLVEWTTAWESNTSYFDIERATDGQNFVAMSQTAAAGNSSAPQTYQLYDPTAAFQGADELSYRIKQVDINGTFSYSAVRTVKLPQLTARLTAFPNPVRDQLHLRFLGPASNPGQISIMDLSGRLVYQANTSGGNEELSLDVADWQAGLYLLRWEQGGGQVMSQIMVQ